MSLVAPRLSVADRARRSVCMSVKLRVMRFGKRNRPAYRVGVIDSRAPRDGVYIESIGVYNPFIEDDRKKVTLNKERAEYWLKVGAQPSETVASFCRLFNVTGLVRDKKPRKRRPKKTAAPPTAAKKAKIARKAAKKATRKTAAKKKIAAKKKAAETAEE